MTTYTTTPRLVERSGTGFVETIDQSDPRAETGDHHLTRNRSIGLVLTWEQKRAIRYLAERDGLTVSEWIYVAISSYDLETLRERAEVGLRVLASLTELDSRIQHSRDQVMAARQDFTKSGDASSLQQAARATTKVFAFEQVRDTYLSAPKPKRDARLTFNVDPFTATSLHHHAWEVGLRTTPFINLLLMEVLAERGYSDAVMHQRLGEMHDGVGLRTCRHVYEAFIRIANRKGFKALTATKVVAHCTNCARKPVALPRPRPQRDSTYLYKRLRALRAEHEARRAALADRVLVPA